VAGEINACGPAIAEHDTGGFQALGLKPHEKTLAFSRVFAVSQSHGRVLQAEEPVGACQSENSDEEQ
jgi:hypothetical protein